MSDTMAVEFLGDLVDGVVAFLQGAIDTDVELEREPIGCGAELIAIERRRQVDGEGWTGAHDDEVHERAELLAAAHSYLEAARVQSWDLTVYPDAEWRRHLAPSSSWPWSLTWWKPSPDPKRNLVKAGALIAAELDRLMRAEARVEREA